MVDFLNLFGRSRETAQALGHSRARLYRVAYAWTHNAALADDLVQDTLSKAMRKSAQLRDPNARDAWLFTILANCFRDHYRRQREMEDIDELDLPHEHTPETLHDQREIVQKVRATIARLPDAQRQVVTLVDLEGFSYVEVADILSIPIGTVMSRLCRARNAMKAMLLPDLKRSEPDAKDDFRIRRIK